MTAISKSVYKRCLTAVIASAMIFASCSRTPAVPLDQVVLQYEAYLGEIHTYQIETVSLPISWSSEGAVLHIANTGTDVTVHEIEYFRSEGKTSIRLLAREGYPDLLYIRRIGWDPRQLPELDIRFDEVTLFISDKDEWIEYSNDANIPVESLEDTRSDFVEAISYAESQL